MLTKALKNYIDVETVESRCHNIKANTKSVFLSLLCSIFMSDSQNFWSKICFVTNFKIPSNDIILQWDTVQAVNLKTSQIIILYIEFNIQQQL